MFVIGTAFTLGLDARAATTLTATVERYDHTGGTAVSLPSGNLAAGGAGLQTRMVAVGFHHLLITQDGQAPCPIRTEP